MLAGKQWMYGTTAVVGGLSSPARWDLTSRIISRGYAAGGWPVLGPAKSIS